ncbi:hypothetical protein SLNSH_19980 [Alsobacter soli]|uniref:DoxX family protein n=1 Tax=Alsobacter soli TaxID=2109933 RepID=A0A2T1HNJ5_9HYPH|nr:DUF6163 family protein [Alsobacter soli]PSC03225.1 hypothetical protein SLNSH_19980 [Alsobacter soli]
MSFDQQRGSSAPDTHPEGSSIAWDYVLVVFMRVMAAIWVAKGLFYWLTILGVGPHGASFDALDPAGRAVVIIFSVLDLVAGVGLWLTSTWGGVMWLLAVMSHLLVGGLAPALPHLLGVIGVAAESVAVLAYIALSWLAARDV